MENEKQVHKNFP